jgi:hypothetical protein
MATWVDYIVLSVTIVSLRARMRTLFLLLCLVVVAILTSCTDDTLVGSQSGRGPIFPNTVGSYWVYADTTWDDISGEVTSTNFDSIVVTGYFNDHLGRWFVTNKHFFWLGQHYMIQGDTIFSRQVGELLVEGEPVYSATGEYRPAVDTPTTYSLLEEDMFMYRTVTRVDSVITSPAGVFENCYSYTGELSTDIVYNEILAPGVGFVYAHNKITNTMYNVEVSSSSWLVRYYIAPPPGQSFPGR